MQTAAEIHQKLGELFRSMWALTALEVAVERGILNALTQPCAAAELATASGMDVATVTATLDVMSALGFVQASDGKFTAVPGLVAALAGRGGEFLGADLRSTLGQFSQLVEDARHRDRSLEGWRATNPALIEAQATVSEGASDKLVSFLSSLDGLSTRLHQPGAAILDVGAGGAGFCISMARAFPQARVVGLEPAPAALAEGKRRVIAAGLADRIELRQIGLEEFTDVDAYDLAYVAQMFMPEAALTRGLPMLLRSFRPGAWLVTAATCAPGADLPSAISRFRTATWGGQCRLATDVATLLEAAGFQSVRVIPGPPGAVMSPVVARRSS